MGVAKAARVCMKLNVPLLLHHGFEKTCPTTLGEVKMQYLRSASALAPMTYSDSLSQWDGEEGDEHLLMDKYKISFRSRRIPPQECEALWRSYTPASAHAVP